MEGVNSVCTLLSNKTVRHHISYLGVVRVSLYKGVKESNLIKLFLIQKFIIEGHLFVHYFSFVLLRGSKK